MKWPSEVACCALEQAVPDDGGFLAKKLEAKRLKTEKKDSERAEAQALAKENEVAFRAAQAEAVMAQLARDEARYLHVTRLKVSNLNTKQTHF